MEDDLEPAVKRAFERIDAAPILPENWLAVKEFLLDKQRSPKVGPRRVLKLATECRRLAEKATKPFIEMKEADTKNLMTPFLSNGFSENTRNDYSKTVRMFFRHLYKCKKYDNPDVISWVEVSPPKWTKTAEDNLTSSEWARILEATPDIQDRAFVWLYYETGPREQDILRAKVGDVKEMVDSQGIHYIQLSIRRRKGGNAGTIPFIQAKGALGAYLNCHPQRNNPNAPLFYVEVCEARTRKERKNHEPAKIIGIKPLSDSAGRKRLKAIFKKAGVAESKAHFHTFRHTAVANWKRAGISEDSMCRLGGWAPGSKMPSLYGRQAIDDLANDLAKVAGKGEFKPEVKYRKCEGCGHENPVDQFCCGDCGHKLGTLMPEQTTNSTLLDFGAILGKGDEKHFRHVATSLRQLFEYIAGADNPEAELKDFIQYMNTERDSQVSVEAPGGNRKKPVNPSHKTKRGGAK